MFRRTAWIGLLAGALLAACGSGETDTTSTGGSGGAAGAGVGGAQTGGSGGSGGSGGVTDPRFDPLIAAVEKERVKLGAPGVAVAVIEDGEVTFARGFGSKDPNADVPVEATTLFRIGSVSKMLTSVAMLRQVAAGKVDLSAPVTDYVPDFHFNADAAWAPSITGQHLLTHASGMSDYLQIDVAPSQQTDAALKTYLTGQFASVDYLMAPAGAFYNYSNPNFYLAGLIAEETSGKPYRQLMKEEVFSPLGMDRTFFLGSEVIADGDYALGKSGNYPGIPEVVLPDSYDNAWARPAGYATSSVLDLAKFVKFLLEGNDAVLPEQLVLEMQSPQINTFELLDLVHYGYGLLVADGVFLGGLDKFHSMKLVQHGGNIPGFAALVTYLPESRFGFIALANADGANFVESTVAALATLAPLPAPSTPPDLTVDPATFTEYEGMYQDDFNVGAITITKVGDTLEIDMPAVDQAGVPYDHVLTPSSPGNFQLGIQGTTLPLTFLKDGTGVYRYMRTRPFVGVRPGAPTAPPPAMTEAARARLLDAIRSAGPDPAERLFRPGVLSPKKSKVD